MNESESERNSLEVLAEEFIERYRRGERPPVSEYSERYPELAEEIVDLFPAMLMMENLKPADEDESASPGMVAPPFEQIGDYRIIREVGRGGMGVVYEAEQVSLGRHVALKVLSKELHSNPKQRKRFEREAKTAARLHHTNIVPVFGVGSENDHSYYVMQFIQGLSLDSVLAELKTMRLTGSASGIDRTTGQLEHRKYVREESGRSDASAAEIARLLLTGEFRPARVTDQSFESSRVEEDGASSETSAATRTRIAGHSSATSRLSDLLGQSNSSVALPGSTATGTVKVSKRPTYWESIAQIGVQVGRALEYAHAQGVLHRDIKPANLVLDVKGTVWVTDFGLARLENERDLTQTGDVLGTLRYMAPETFKGHTDARSEIYSLGLTLYELLAFRPAFDQRHRNALLDQVMNSSVVPLSQANPEVPADLQMIVQKSIERDPADRYSTVAALADDLQRFINDEPIQARRVSKRERLIRWSRHNKGLSASLAAVALLVLFIAVGSTISAAYFQNVSGKLQQTVSRLTQTQREAQTRAAENFRLVGLAQESEQRELELREIAEDNARTLRSTLYAAEMNLASQAAEEPAGLLRIGEITNKWKSDDPSGKLRGWEWHYLESLRRRERLNLSCYGAYCIQWSPDGRQLFGGDLRGVINRYDAETGELQQELIGHQSYVQDLALSPDGTKLASASRDRTIRIWDVITGQTISVLTGHTLYVHGISWNSDGTRLASTASDQTGELFVWDVASGEAILKQTTRPSEAKVEWNPRLDLIATDRAVYDSNTGNLLWEHHGWQTSWSPVGDRLAVVLDRATILDSTDGSVILELSESTAGSRSLDWSPDGRLLAIAFDDNTASVWETVTGQKVAVLRGHTDWVLDVQWSLDGKQLATAGSGTFKIWDWPVRDNPQSISIGDGLISSIFWDEVDSQLITGGPTGVYRHDVDQQTSEEQISPQVFGEFTTFSPNLGWNAVTRKLAIREQGHIALYDMESGQSQLKIPELAGSKLRSLDVNPNGTQLVTSSWLGGDTEKSAFRVHSLESGEEQWTAVLHPHLTGSVSWSPDGRRIACGGWGMAAILDVASGEVLSEFSGSELKWINAITWDPDSSRAALACMDRTIYIIDTETGSEQLKLIGHTNSVLSVSWSPDGSRIASGGQDNTVRVWDVEAGHQLVALRSELTKITAVAWSPSGMQLAAGTGDGQIRIWSAQPRSASADRQHQSSEITTSAIHTVEQLERLIADAARHKLTYEECYNRGELLARLGRWKDCAENNLQLTQIDPARRISWSCSASPLLLANDHDEYRRLCRAMVEQFRNTSEADVADTVCKVSLLLPDTIPLSELPIETLRRGTSDPNWDFFHDWFNACSALIAYREGTFEAAIEWTEKLDTVDSYAGSLAILVRAMAEERLGRHDDAVRSLARAESQLPLELRSLGTPGYTGPLPVGSDTVAHDWLMPEILRREATKLINPNPAP